MWLQNTIRLSAKSRGFHLVTDEIVLQLNEINDITIGLLHLFIQHTSASLTINENQDPSVRADFEQFFHRLVPEDQSYYTHIYEGSDDLPAHFKSSLLSQSLSIPITDGRLNLGTWQGIYLGEHRNHAGARKIIATLHGQKSNIT